MNLHSKRLLLAHSVVISNLGMCTLCSLQGMCLLDILAALAMAAFWCAGLTPDSLYGKFTWKIENFDQVQKRELRSDVFVVGDYKWSVAFVWHCHRQSQHICFVPLRLRQLWHHCPCVSRACDGLLPATSIYRWQTANFHYRADACGLSYQAPNSRSTVCMLA